MLGTNASSTYIAVAIRARTAESTDQISFKAGDTLVIVETVNHGGGKWYRGFVKGIHSPASAAPLMGIFPDTHVVVKPSQPHQAPISTIPEMTSSLPLSPPPTPASLTQVSQTTASSSGTINADTVGDLPPTASSVSARIMALRKGGLQVQAKKAEDKSLNGTALSPPPPPPLTSVPPPVDLPPAPPRLPPKPSVVPLQASPPPSNRVAIPAVPAKSPKSLVPSQPSARIQRAGVERVNRNNSQDKCSSTPSDDKSIVGLYRKLCAESSTAPATKSSALSSSLSHLFFELKACIASICGHGEYSELIFSLYNRAEGQFISENYVVKMTFNGMPKDEEKIGNICTIFADLAKKDLGSEIYLICKIIRCGRMVLTDKDLSAAAMASSDDGSQIFGQSFRRPFGFAVLDVTGIIRRESSLTSADKEYLMRIYTAQSESSFPTLFDNIINKSGGFETSNRAEMLVVSVDYLQGALRSVAKKTGRQGIQITQRMGFPDIILPGDMRNSIYVTLMAGDFAQSRGKSSSKNFETAVEVRLSNGLVLPDSISRGSGERNCEQFESTVYYHSGTPRWLETFRVDLPAAVDLEHGAHLFVSVRQCSQGERGDKADKAFAFGVVPLTASDGTVISNSTHTLRLFKYDKKSSLAEVYGPCLLPSGAAANTNDHQQYLSPLVIDDGESQQQLASNSKLTPLKETLSLRTSLCSTKLTHNSSLLNLLRWNSLSRQQLIAALKDFTFIGPIEIMKYLQEILDTLLIVFQQDEFQSTTAESDLIFSDLVFILNIVISDRRFVNFRPILDVYVRDHYGKGYSIVSAWHRLLSSMIKIASNPSDPVQGKELRSYLKAIEYLFKFIVKSFQSCESSSGRQQQQLRQEFTDLVNEFFSALIKNIICPSSHGAFIQSGPAASRESVSSSAQNHNSAILIGAQILVLQNIHSVLSELVGSGLIPSSDLVRMAVDCLTLLEVDKRKISEAKLQLCVHLAGSCLFSASEVDRETLVEVFSQIMSREIEQCADSTALTLSLKLLLAVMGALCAKQSTAKEELPMLSRYPGLVKLLLPVMDIFLQLENIFPQEKPEVIAERRRDAAIATLSLFWSLSTADLSKHLMSHSSGTLESFMEKSSVVFRTLAAADELASPFPADWTAIFEVVYIVAYKSALSLLKVLREVYSGVGSGGNDVEKERWMNFTKMLASIIVSIPGSKQLSSSTVSAHGSAAGGDIRLSLIMLLREVWKSLSSASSFVLQLYAAEIMRAFVELTLYGGSFASCEKVRDVALDCVVEIIEISHRQNSECRHSLPVGNRKSSSAALLMGFNSNARSSSVSTSSVSNSNGIGSEVIRLNSVEVECIDCLDQLIMTERKGDQAYRDWFSMGLQARLGSSEKAGQYSHFLRSVSKFLGLVFALRKTASKTSSDVADDNAVVDAKVSGNSGELALLLANLLHFTALLGRTRIFVKYIHRLVDIQLSKEITVAEAGWALKLHADLLEWDTDRQLEAVDSEVRVTAIHRTLLQSVDRPKNSKPPTKFLLLEGLLSSADLDTFHQPQSAFRRKEILYLCIVQLFIISQHFEHAIELAECVADQYRRTTFDYRKLSRILRVIARLTERILDQERYYPAYYRVAFIGRGWDEEWGLVYGKQFIYRAKEWEKLGEFTERLLVQYPGAKVVASSNTWPPDPKLAESRERWLQICMVELLPDADRFPHIFDQYNLQLIPDQIRLWYENNDSDRFSFSRPFRKKSTTSSAGNKTSGGGGGENEFLNLWTEMYSLRTEHPFPNFLRRSEVVECVRTEVSPIENAVRNMEAKNRELELLERKYRQFLQPSDSIGNGNGAAAVVGDVNCNPLTMCLNGSVDAPVNGGVPMYKKAFLTPAFAERHPEYRALIVRLAELIDQQVLIIHRAIAVHEQLISADLRPLHETLIQFFHKNFAADIDRLGLLTVKGTGGVGSRRSSIVNE